MIQRVRRWWRADGTSNGARVMVGVVVGLTVAAILTTGGAVVSSLSTSNGGATNGTASTATTGITTVVCEDGTTAEALSECPLATPAPPATSRATTSIPPVTTAAEVPLVDLTPIEGTLLDNGRQPKQGFFVTSANLQGDVYDRVLGASGRMCPTGGSYEVQYDLNGQFSEFLTELAYHPRSTDNGVFRIKISIDDGPPLYTKEIGFYTDRVRDVQLDVAGAKRLVFDVNMTEYDCFDYYAMVMPEARLIPANV